MKHAHDDRRCRDLLMRMARGVEGDLPAAERRALARHLAGCRRCGAFSKSLQRAIALCREGAAPRMSARARARARGNVRRALASAARGQSPVERKGSSRKQ